MTFMQYLNDDVKGPEKDWKWDDAELDQIRWLMSLYLNVCGAMKSGERGMCFAPRNWKTGNNNGRCKFHGGASKNGPINRRQITLNKLTKLDTRSKLDISILNPTELKLYDDLQEMIKSEYDITDKIAISQIAKLLIFQNFLIDKMQQGFSVSIEGSSNEIRKWLSEYGLTPKSKTVLGLDTNELEYGGWARIIKEVHDREMAKLKEAEVIEIEEEPKQEEE